MPTRLPANSPVLAVQPWQTLPAPLATIFLIPLVPIILMASVIGATVGIAMKFTSGLREGGYIPFGPFLALAGLTTLAFGPGTVLSWVGL